MSWRPRRSRKSNIPWDKFEHMRLGCPLPKLKIVHSIRESLPGCKVMRWSCTEAPLTEEPDELMAQVWLYPEPELARFPVFQRRSLRSTFLVFQRSLCCSASAVRLAVIAPRKAWRVLWGGSPHRERVSHPPVSSLAPVAELVEPANKAGEA